MNNEDENLNEDLNDELKPQERESRDTVALGDIPEDEVKEIDKRTWCQRTFGKMKPGSLRGSIFNLCILSLGT